MSIRLKNEINAISARVELLERAIKKLTQEPKDKTVKAVDKKAKAEGDEA